MRRSGVAGCALDHAPAYPRASPDLSGCPDCPLSGQRELIGREPDAQTNPGGDPPLGFRSPLSYFHNGFAKNLNEVVDFYNTRFNIKLTYREKSDLVAFLGSL